MAFSKLENLAENILNDKSLSKELVYRLSDRACDYRQGACYRRCDADMAEDAWRDRRDKLLKDYDKVIVNSKKIPNIKGLNIIDCYSFQELFDAQKLLEKPIIYFEIVKDQKALFFIIDGDDMYQFVLKECDVDYKI